MHETNSFPVIIATSFNTVGYLHTQSAFCIVPKIS